MQRRRTRWAAAVVIFFFSAVVVEAALIASHWPFTRSAVSKSLREQARGEIKIHAFEQFFFPRPGCVARGLEIHRGPGSSGPPLITVDRLTVFGDYGGLLTFSKHLQEVRAEGVHIRVPRHDPASSVGNGGSPPKISMDKFIAERTVLEFTPENPGDQPYRIEIHRAVLSPANASAVMSFDASLRVPEPPGEVRASGRFGPWQERDPYLSPVRGTFRFDDADLGKFEGLKGTLRSTGRFEGTVADIGVTGETEVPDFEIRSTGHRVDVKARFQANVNGRNGDVTLRRVDAKLLNTTVVAEGTVAARGGGEAKTLSLNMEVKNGRIQDLLRLVSSRSPGLNGPVGLRFRVTLPPGGQRFLRRLRLTGVMGVRGGRFQNPETQQKLEQISRNAIDGEDDPAEVVSDLWGNISAADGVARLSGVSFRVPGASAILSGTYHLITHRVDLHGTAKLDEKLSQTSKGIKSFLLKALDPFFRKKEHLSVVPVRVTGTYGHASVNLDLNRSRGSRSRN